MAEIVLRRAEEGDVTELAAIAVASWQATFAGAAADAFLSTVSDTSEAERFSRVLSHAPQTELWLVVEDGAIAGYGTIGPDREPEAPSAVQEVYDLYMRPAVWGRGLGKRLHNRLLARLGERGAKRAELWVLERNPQARGMYEALGWEETGRRREIGLGAQHHVLLQYGRALDAA